MNIFWSAVRAAKWNTKKLFLGASGAIVDTLGSLKVKFDQLVTQITGLNAQLDTVKVG